MNICINPWCRGRENSDEADRCQSCDTPLLIDNRYWLRKYLCDRGETTATELFEIEDLQDPQTPKVLKVIKDINPQLIKLFQREQDILIRHRHEGIPKGEAAFSVLTSKGEELPCLVMEKIPGQNLEQWVKEHGVINQEQACQWLEQISKILDFIHKQGLLHRDIKPSNIMRRSDGKLVLIDFGIARPISHTVLSGKAVTYCGTPGYMAPEQNDSRVVQQSDFYGLGKTFVYLLTGIHPEHLDITKWHTNTKHHISPSLIALIDWMLEYFYNKRPKNAKVILKRLHQIQHPNPMIWLTRTGFAVAGVAGIVIGINFFSPKACDSKINDSLSCGEEIFIPGNPRLEKAEGVQAFKARDYQKAILLLEKAWKWQPDPETLIYLNNARIEWGIKQGKIPAQKVYTIAVVVPLNNTPNQETPRKGLEVLRGVAQAQSQAIDRGMNLKVLIADDSNRPQKAVDIAKKLANKPDVLAVIGHQTSEVTKATKPIYEQERLVLVSCTAISEELRNDLDKSINDIFFFRTVHSVSIKAAALNNYLRSQGSQNKVAIFWSIGSFSRSFKNEFSKIASKQVVDLGDVFDLSSDSFNSTLALQKAKQQGATAIFLIPDSGTSPNALDNALKVIQANKGRFQMFGGGSLYSPKVAIKAANKLVLVISWHSLSSPNREFPKLAKAFWKGDVSSRTAQAYDATLVLAAALKQQPSRQGIQKVLSDKKFQVTGATGLVQFQGGDRKENPNLPGYALVKVVPKCVGGGYGFVPADKGLKCS